MKKNSKPVSSFYSDDAPGIAGVLYSILANILTPIIVVVTLCFVVNFACEFAGVDFDAFTWTGEFLAGLPSLLEEWFTAGKELVTELLKRVIP